MLHFGWLWAMRFVHGDGCSLHASSYTFIILLLLLLQLLLLRFRMLQMPLRSRRVTTINVKLESSIYTTSWWHIFQSRCEERFTLTWRRWRRWPLLILLRRNWDGSPHVEHVILFKSVHGIDYAGLRGGWILLADSTVMHNFSTTMVTTSDVGRNCVCCARSLALWTQMTYIQSSQNFRIHILQDRL